MPVSVLANHFMASGMGRCSCRRETSCRNGSYFESIQVPEHLEQLLYLFSKIDDVDFSVGFFAFSFFSFIFFCFSVCVLEKQS